MPNQLLTTAQYAKIRKVSKVSVTRAMKSGKKLIGVESYQKIGRDWFLTFSNINLNKNVGKCVVIQE